MKTSCVISNITWNTPEFFRATAERLVKDGFCDWVHGVPHEPESDETKAHIHFILKPTKAVDTAWLRVQFSQFVPGEDKPRQPTSDWRKVAYARIADWWLYSCHDEAYLASKLQARTHHYGVDDCISTDPELLRVWDSEYRRPRGHIDLLKDAAARGLPFATVAMSGAIPLALLRSAEVLYNGFLLPARTDRAGKPGHGDGEEKPARPRVKVTPSGWEPVEGGEA